jgi:hypothetical protein
LIQNTYNPRRVEQPMKRTNPQKGCAHDSSFEPVSWDEAYKIIINAILWQTHPNGRAKHSEPPLAHEAIAECDHAIRDEGHWLTIVLFAPPIIAPHISLPILTIARGGVALIGGCAFWKWTIILRSGYFQGFYLAKTSQRGSGKFVAPARLDGWRR